MGKVSVQVLVFLTPNQPVLTDVLVVVMVVVMKAGLLLVALAGRLLVGDGLPPLPGRLLVMLGTELDTAGRDETEAGREDGRTGTEAEAETDEARAETGELDGRTELTGGIPELEERSDETMTELKELDLLAGADELGLADEKTELDDGFGQLTMADGGFWNVVISLGRTLVQSVRPWMSATPSKERRR